MGAQEAALRVEEEAVLKEVRAQANRLANCDEANSRRSNDAAVGSWTRSRSWSRGQDRWTPARACARWPN